MFCKEQNAASAAYDTPHRHRSTRQRRDPPKYRRRALQDINSLCAAPVDHRHAWRHAVRHLQESVGGRLTFSKDLLADRIVAQPHPDSCSASRVGW